MSLSNRLNAVEARICAGIARRIVYKGYTARVWDGEEFAGPWTGDRAEIENQIGHTEKSRVFVRNRQGVGLGHIELIHGEGEDTVQDYTIGLDHIAERG